MALTTDVTIGSTPPRDGTAPSTDGRFWLADPSGDPKAPTPVHVSVVEWAQSLRSVWRMMAQLDYEHDTIYENRALRYGNRLLPGVRALDAAGFDTSRLFVTTSIVDTFAARMAKRKTMPMFVVDDGDFDLKQKAQDFRRWLHGGLRETGVERLHAQIIQDCEVRGDGVLYVDDGDDELIVERCHRSELLIDPYEAKQSPGAVRTLYRIREVSRDALIDRFPAFKPQILAAPQSSTDGPQFRGDWLADESKAGARDVVELVEAWHLPSCNRDDEDDRTDGRVAVCIAGATLYFEEWADPRFPFARLSRYTPQRGYWGRGNVELLRGQQAELNRMIADIAMNIAVTGKGIWMVPTVAESQIQPEQLAGYRPYILPVPPGGQPQFVHPPAVSPATIDLLERKIRFMHDLVGAAQWSAQGRSPLGAGASGVAIDTMEDLLSDRHSPYEERVGHYRLDVAQAMLDAGRRLAERTKKSDKRRAKLATTWLEKGSAQKLDWKDVSIEDDRYTLQLEPVSYLSTTRSGKTAQAAELVKTGVIPAESAAVLFDEPDIAHANRIHLADRRNAERLLELVGRLDQDLPEVHEWHPLDILPSLTRKFFNRAQVELAHAPREIREEVEKRYLDFGDMVDAVIDQLAAKEQQEPAQPPPGMPGPDAAGPMGPEEGIPMDPSMMPPGAA